MASNENEENEIFEDEGGAMLTPNNAQSSFDNRKPNAQEIDLDSKSSIEEVAETMAGSNFRGTYNGFEIDGSRYRNPQDIVNDYNEHLSNPELVDAAKKGESSGLEKAAIKKGAEAALEATGVPPAAAKEIVKKADETGALEGVIGKAKKKKIGIVLSILSALMPFIGWMLGLVIVVVLVFNVFGSFAGGLSYLQSLLEFSPEVVAESLDDLGTDLFSGSILLQTYLGASLPNHGYVDLQVADAEADEQRTVQNSEVVRLSEINAAILALPYYYESEYGDPNEVRLSELFEDITLNNIGEKSKQLESFFNKGEIYRVTAEDTCILSFASLSVDGKSYFQKILNKSGELNKQDYEKAISKLNENECKGTGGIGGKFDVVAIVSKINFAGIATTIGNLINPQGTSMENALEEVKKIPAQIFQEVMKQGNPLNQKLHNNIGEYKYDEATYKKFLSTYYVEKTYGNLIKDDKGEFTENIKNSFVNGVLSYTSSIEEIAESSLKNRYNNAKGSGNENQTLIDSLGSIYGDSKCSILEQYEPLTHEYITSRSIDNDDIHSVTDGEVVDVIYSEGNLYSKYDQKSGKCMCDGTECKNPNGSEIRIKFTYDEIEYVAVYSNLAEIRVGVGDIVKKGDVIATEGNSGCTSTKKLTFKIISENGISYSTNELLQRCSSFANTTSLCNFQNININLHDCNGEFIKTLSFYDYIKEETYRKFKAGINNKEFLKAASLIVETNTLDNSNYQVGMAEIDIKSCNYKEEDITESEILDQAIGEVMGEAILYNGKFANAKYSNMCDRTDKDKAANSIYNELCVNEAIKLADSKTYDEILNIYYPNFYISKNYCNEYASKINAYSLNNGKKYLLQNSYSMDEILKINSRLKEKTELVKFNTRASTVEAARFLALGIKYRIPYQNGGKYFELGFNTKWYEEGIDSSGFVSWALLNGGAKIDKSMTSKELIANNVVGSLKITSSLYKYYDKIQVGDFAYSEERIGLIIGKNDGILYVAEANSKDGLIVTTITSYGESSSNYTHIYYADDYYNGVGNLTSMW